MLGWALPARWPVPGIDLKMLGAVVTNPVGQGKRTPANDRGLLPFPGGALLHSGLANPGLNRILGKYRERWAQSSLPVWVHLISSNPGELQAMVRRLEGCEGVGAIELGLAPDLRPDEILALTEAAYGELPLVLHLPLTAAGEGWLSQLSALAISAISLGAPRGVLPNSSGNAVTGRLYGPALLPQTLNAVRALRHLGIPLIAGPGIYSRAAAQTVLNAGAIAIQLDTVLWKGWAA
jgi:dihydroorotate dehydrogenase (NAD+) catalytic subunit